jgi:hypothetical protein
MRITVYQKSLAVFLGCIVLGLVANTVCTLGVTAQDEPALIIEIYDSNSGNQIADSIVFEGKSYDITVSSANETVILGVNLSLLGKTYLTSVDELFITVQAPLFDVSDSFVITATKNGYQPSDVEVSVLKGELFITADRGTVEERKEFQLTVKDQDDKPVEDAQVYVTTEATPLITDQHGTAYARAPDVESITTATIQVIKSGYLPGSTIIRIEHVEGSIFELTESNFLKILPILIAVLVVIFSIVFVLIGKKRTPKPPRLDTRAGSPDEPLPSEKEKQSPRFKNEPAALPVKEKRDISASKPESRVEEIRIPVQAKQKETTYLSEEKDPEQVSEDQKKQQNEWFKGQDYMRYKLDELTGKIDQKTDGKWFEGEHDIQYKVDETLKKNRKKKKVDEVGTK